MARYDEISETNWLTKKEKRIQKANLFVLFFALADLFLLLFRPVRRYHFQDFPNYHFIGICLLLLMAIIRLWQAYEEGKDPYMEASRAWRAQHDMLGAYDFEGPGPDYSNKWHNVLFFTGSLAGFGLIGWELVKRLM